MAQVPLAFSIHNFINSVGADAGFAAIIGLAILVLLYFAHARETANLREEAALLTQRLMQAEARVAQLTRAQSAQAPPAAAPAAAPASVGSSQAAPAFPFAPAGVGAPALAAATRVVPLAATAAARPATAAASWTPASARPAPVEELAPSSAPRATRQPFTAGQYERPAAAPVAAPASATVAGGNGAGHDAPVGVADVTPAPPRQPSRAGARGGPPPLPPVRGRSRRPSGLRRIGGALAAAVVIAGVIAVLVVATSGGSTSSTSTHAARTTNAPAPQRTQAAAPPFSPSLVTVSVLNGTNVNQLAHKVAAVLVGKGYKQGNLFTAPSQTQASTVVSYLPGAANRTAALHVATALNLKPSAVQPIDSSTQQVACPPTAPCTASVVVTVGADLSTL